MSSKWYLLLSPNFFMTFWSTIDSKKNYFSFYFLSSLTIVTWLLYRSTISWSLWNLKVFFTNCNICFFALQSSFLLQAIWAKSTWRPLLISLSRMNFWFYHSRLNILSLSNFSSIFPVFKSVYQALGMMLCFTKSSETKCSKRQSDSLHFIMILTIWAHIFLDAKPNSSCTLNLLLFARSSQNLILS